MLSRSFFKLSQQMKGIFRPTCTRQFSQDIFQDRESVYEKEFANKEDGLSEVTLAKAIKKLLAKMEQAEQEEVKGKVHAEEILSLKVEC